HGYNLRDSPPEVAIQRTPRVGGSRQERRTLQQHVSRSRHSGVLLSVRHAPSREAASAIRLPDSELWTFHHQGIRVWRLLLLGDKPQHGCDAGSAVFLPAWMGSTRRISRPAE